MTTYRDREFFLLLLAAVALMFLPSCSVIEYGGLQRRFNRAVELDNMAAVSPYVDGRADYRFLLEELTPEYIQRLDVRMRPNAWMLRGICAWRTGSWSVARDAARKGLSLDPSAGSRDAVILTLIPGLVFEKEAAERWLGESNQSEQSYNSLRGSLKAAWQTMALAERSVGQFTPATTVHYLNYQKWRLAINWAGMIADVTEADTDLGRFRAMNEWAKTMGGVGSFPAAAAESAKNKVKGALRALIDAQSR